MSAQGQYRSWGGLRAVPREVIHPVDSGLLEAPPASYLAFGNGRSYGDTCLPEDGALLDMRGAARILAFSPETGVLRAEAGAMLADILEFAVPRGWFVPVVPGTRFVTLGGALANDIHGKNHHGAGTFGAHVLAFELVRSDGSRRLCTPDRNGDWFAATIGGMGLTGVVTWVDLALMPIGSPWITQSVVPLASLEAFFACAEAGDRDFTYSVAWIDSLATGADMGRGVLFRGNHASGAQAAAAARLPVSAGDGFSFPFMPPFSLLNRASLTVFNWLYRRASLRGRAERLIDYRSFFFPLDKMRHWNRVYGPKGLRQFQCVLPLGGADQAVRALLRAAQQAGQASFLTVLKLFGDRASPGLLSFPRRGVTLTLDFPYRGPVTDRLLAELDRITLAAGGAVNPYKDARMTAAVFTASFPNWRGILPYIDPNARSIFSVRVGLHPLREGH